MDLDKVNLLSLLKNALQEGPEPEQRDSGRILGEGVFMRVLEKERCRADRSGTMFTLLVIPLDRHSLSPELEKRIYSLLKSNLRIVDEIGWLNRNRLGILLSNTPREGAHRFLKRLQAMPDFPVDLKNYGVYSYPESPPSSPERIN